MAKHGQDKKLKRLNVPKSLTVAKKEHVWMVKPSPGGHKAGESVALVAFLRDLLGVAETYKEASHLIVNGKVYVNGRVIKNPKFPVGFMDVVSLPSANTVYYLDLDERGHFTVRRDDSRKYRIAKVVRKTIARRGKTQYTLDDGHTFFSDEKYSVGDSLKVELPSYKVSMYLPFTKSAKGVILRGKHMGTRGQIVEIGEGNANAKAKVTLKASDGSDVVTLKDYIFIEE